MEPLSKTAPRIREPRSPSKIRVFFSVYHFYLKYSPRKFFLLRFSEVLPYSASLQSAHLEHLRVTLHNLILRKCYWNSVK